MKCGVEWYDFHCDYSTSFVSNIRKACLKLPSMTPLGYLDIKNGNIVLEYRDEMQIKTNCKDLIIKNASCFNVFIELWGIRSHSTGLYIAFKAESKQRGSSLSIPHPCDSNAILSIPCDNNIRYQRVSESQTCYNITDNTMVNKLAYYVDNHHSSYSDASNISPIITYSLDNIPIMTSLIGSSLIWIIIIIILCKK